MSIEDLKEQKILLPEKEWGEHRLTTTISQIPLLITFLGAIAGCVLAYTGDGDTWTWVGVVLFFLSFYAVVVLCDRAVVKQRERMQEESQKEELDG